MSYDLQVWSVYPAARTTLKDNLEWSEGRSGWAHTARDWQIVVSHSDQVMAEDIPDGVTSHLPGIEYLTLLNLEGRVSEAAKRAAVATATGLARACHGVIIDPQEETQWTPSGVKRLKAVKGGGSSRTLFLSWWFLEGPLFSRSGRERFLDLLAREFPEVLPKRYGLWEPPQYLFAETGREHLLAFLDEHLPTGLPIVWHPHRPVIHVHLGFPKSPGGSPSGFRSNHLQIQVNHEALNQPGWEAQLRRFWLRMNRLIHPFYSEARTLSGGIFPHPVRSWWWRGVPTQLGHAVALGESYQQLWPGFLARARIDDGLALASVEDWAREAMLENTVGNVPSSIAAKPFVWPEGMHPNNAPVNTPDSYPEQWPFEPPFSQAHS